MVVHQPATQSGQLVRVDQDERENRVAVLTDDRRLSVSRAGYTRLNSLL
jgi:hypothetical protein